jgi:hypothetical protein
VSRQERAAPPARKGQFPMPKHTTVCYLIHFITPLGNLNNKRGQASHYIGQSTALAARLEAHRLGYGAKIMAAVARAGISWSCVRTWEDGTSERALKALHNAPRLCPVCQGLVTIETRRPGRRPMAARPVDFYRTYAGNTMSGKESPAPSLTTM